jgi:prepilin-type processing-associated H-X9-DG protein
LRQLQLAWQNYAHDNQDRLVPNWILMNGGWESSASTSNSWVSGTAYTTDSTAGIRLGALWNYTGKAVGLYRCPADKSLWSYGGKRVPRPFNVALSIALNGRIDDTTTAQSEPGIKLKWAHIPRPTDIFTFIDKDEKSMTHGTFVPNVLTESWHSLPGERDRARGANVAYADGHVAFHRWQYLGRIRTGLSTPVTNAADRADFKWLLSRIPTGR